MNPRAKEVSGITLDIFKSKGMKIFMLAEIIGRQVFTLFSQKGYPSEMFFDELKEKVDFDKETIFLSISYYQFLSILHAKKAGKKQKSIEKQQERNVNVILNFWEKGIIDNL